MENLEQNTSPSGEAGATASQGQLDANETQPSETAQGVSDAQATEEGQASNPWDNDPKFKGKSPEDIYKAYKESEKLSGQLSQKAQIANLLEEKYGVTPEQLKAQIEAQEIEAQRQRYAANPTAAIYDEIQGLKQQLARQEQEKVMMQVEKELDSYLSENPEYAPFKDKMLKLGLTTEQDKSWEEIGNEWFGQARAQGQNDAYKKIEVKKQTPTTQSTVASKKSLSVEDMETMPIEDLRAYYGVQ